MMSKTSLFASLLRCLVTAITLMFGFTSTTQAQSRILLVSDVDDTIKHSNVRSMIDKGLNAFWGYEAFPGMAELYRYLSRSPELSIHYVSNAPESLMQERHLQFLQKFNFPQVHHLKTRPDINDEKFKVRTILELVTQEQPQVLILVGDDGERDPQVFQTIREGLNGKDVKVLSFVHTVYSVPIEQSPASEARAEEHAVRYVTPFEVASHLMAEGLLHDSDFKALSADIIPKLISDLKNIHHSKTFPEWSSCRGFQSKTSAPATPPEGFEELQRLINQRCAPLISAR